MGRSKDLCYFSYSCDSNQIINKLKYEGCNSCIVCILYYFVCSCCKIWIEFYQFKKVYISYKKVYNRTDTTRLPFIFHCEVQPWKRSKSRRYEIPIKNTLLITQQLFNCIPMNVCSIEIHTCTCIDNYKTWYSYL